MFKPGDKYIHFTNYGSISFGTVKHVHEVNITDINNSVVYVSVSIINDKNQCLELDGTDGRIYRIIKDLNEEEIKTLKMIGQRHGHGIGGAKLAAKLQRSFCGFVLNAQPVKE